MKKHVYFIMGLSFLISCAERPPRVDKIIKNGVEVVLNHLEPYKIGGEPKSVEAIEEFRLDLEAAELEELGISDVKSLEVDSNGSIFFLAERASENLILKFDSQGKYVTSFGTRGQGPGEIKNATFFCINKRDQVIVTDSAGPKFVVFSQEGTFMKEIRLPLRLRAVFPLDNGNYVGLKQSIDREGFEPSLQSSLCLYDAEFKEIKELGRHRPSDYMALNKMDGIPQIFHWEVRAGRIYAGDGKRGYEVLVYSQDGILLRKVHKEYRPVGILEEYKRVYMSQFPENDPWRKMIFFSSDMPPYSEFIVDDTGRLIVISYEEDQGGRGYLCDIFNNEGILILRKNLKISHRGQDLLLSGQGWGIFNHFVATKDRLYYLRTKENGYRELVVNKMAWE